ncbi:MAG: ATP-grasp domain-containing protein [Hyphomicrobiaceae bacterium]
MNNLDREIVASVRRYGETHQLDVRTYSHDWIVELEHDGRVHHVFGYDLGLNSSTTHRLCNDKAATYEVLSAHGVNAFPHYLFLHPRWLDYVAVDGNWARMLETFKTLGGDVVVKDNEGTGGKEVLRATTVKELEQVATTIFETARSLAISPYLDIQVELRFVLLDGAPLLVYAKDRPVVIGDGQQTIGALIAGLDLPPDVDREILAEIAPLHPATHVPDRDEVITVQWRHNLGRGGRPRMLDVNDPDLEDALDLARAAAAHTNLRFGSVDIAVVDGAPKVLEINSGVMLEHLSDAADDGAALADRIYHAVLDRVFGKD